MDNLLHRKSSKSIPDAIIVEDKLATDKGKIADAFNKYFATVCMTNEMLIKIFHSMMNISKIQLMHLLTLNKLKIPQCFTS